MLVDQLIAAAEPGGYSLVDLHKQLDSNLTGLAEQIRIEELTPRVLFPPLDPAESDKVVPIRKSDALRATWGIAAAQAEDGQ